MSCFAIMAVRPPEEGKSRLSTVLDQKDRKSLNIRMFNHVFDVLKGIFPLDHIVVISRSAALLDAAVGAGVHALMESGDGLNEALAEASRFAVSRGATALLTLSSDLPFLGAEDVRALLAADGDVVIATDRTHIGTNALLMRRPLAIPYRYGDSSLTAHRAAAAEADLTMTIIDRPGLSRDIDVPIDLTEYR